MILSCSHPFAVKICSRGRSLVGQEELDYINTAQYKGPVIFGSYGELAGGLTEITASRTATGYSVNSPIATLEDTQNLVFEVVPCFRNLTHLRFAIKRAAVLRPTEYYEKRTKLAEDLFQHYCDMQGLERAHCRFLLEGERIDRLDEKGKRKCRSFNVHNVMTNNVAELTISEIGIQNVRSH